MQNSRKELTTPKSDSKTLKERRKRDKKRKEKKKEKKTEKKKQTQEEHASVIKTALFINNLRNASINKKRGDWQDLWHNTRL